MVKLSNFIVGFLNLITFLLSVPILAMGVWLGNNGISQCDKVLNLPVLVLGACLLVVSLLGLLGACCRVSFFLWLYIIILFLMIIGMLGLAMFSVTVTQNGLANSSLFDNQLRLSQYSHWLHRKVLDWESWQKIEDCMKTGNVCGGLIMIQGVMGILKEGDEPYMKKLTFVQSGCCKPPKYCGYEFQNLTYWTVPAGAGLRSEDVDCMAWSNDQEKLCYSCNSCKAGVIATIRAGMKVFTILDACLVFFLTIVYSIACCALRNNHRHYSQYKRFYGS